MISCHLCLRRMWLLERLGGHLENKRTVIASLLRLTDHDLIQVLGGAHVDRLLGEYARFDPFDAKQLEADAGRVGLELTCIHQEGYPSALIDLAELTPPALAINGGTDRFADLCAADPVAIVGTRRATGYGRSAATRIARDLAAAGLTVISGLALGIDSAAHEGALEAGGRTIAVLPAAAQRPYPAGRATLYHRILDQGCGVSELPSSVHGVWRWALQARNRIIAGLARVTVVIEAPKGSGALITVQEADRAGRWIGVLPGPVGVTQSAGTNLLLAKARAGRNTVAPSRVRVIRDAQDILDLIYGEGIIDVPELRPAPTPQERSVLDTIAAGATNVTMIDPRSLTALSSLELKGWVVRGPGGALTLAAG